MPRLFVNSMSNFMIHGGMVSFTLQDVAMRSQGGQPRAGEPEDIVDVVMCEQDFAQLLQFFGQHLAAYQQQAGKQAGTALPGMRATAPKAGEPDPKKGPTGQSTGGFKIRPKGN